MPALLQAGHFDGLFLDTLDSLSRLPGCREGALRLLHRLRSAFPEAILLANRGFDLLASIAADLDGLFLRPSAPTTGMASTGCGTRRNVSRMPGWPPGWES